MAMVLWIHGICIWIYGICMNCLQRYYLKDSSHAMSIFSLWCDLLATLSLTLHCANTLKHTVLIIEEVFKDLSLHSLTLEL